MSRENGTGAVQLDDRQRLAWLRLIRSENIGPITFRDLLAHFGNAEAALDEVGELARRGGRRIRLCPEDEARAEIEALDNIGARLIAVGETTYPSWLTHIDSAPPLLSLYGDAKITARPAIAIVGSRNASLAGCKFARQIARDLGERGYAIASGLARGIDAAAHEAALESGTIAVLAGGLDRIYPPQHGELAERIAQQGGALISEMPLGWEPRARDFPRRNRIVSGVAIGVVIVEAANRSGSLITARLAGEQGRLVFAVPGSPLDPRSAGANRLIRDGAHIVTSVDDMIAEIEPMIGRAPETARHVDESPPMDTDYAGGADDSDRQRVIAALGAAPVETDEIIRFTGLRPAAMHLILLELDLAGRIVRHAGGRVSLNLAAP